MPEIGIVLVCKSAVYQIHIKRREWDNKCTANFHTGGIPNSNSQSQSLTQPHQSHNLLWTKYWCACMISRMKIFPFVPFIRKIHLNHPHNAAIKVQCSIELYLFCYEEKTRKLVFQHKGVRTLFPEIHAKQYLCGQQRNKEIRGSGYNKGLK